MKNLILICEGGISMVGYFLQNRVSPSKVFLSTASFCDYAHAFATDDSYKLGGVNACEILVVINGCTDFSLKEIYKLLEDFEVSKEYVADITIMSNIYLGKITTSYYLYSGDLFYGKTQEITDGMMTTDGDKGSTLQRGLALFKKEKIAIISKKTDENSRINPVMKRYKEYVYVEGQQPQIAGEHAVTVAVVPQFELENLETKVKWIEVM